MVRHVCRLFAKNTIMKYTTYKIISFEEGHTSQTKILSYNGTKVSKIYNPQCLKNTLYGSNAPTILWPNNEKHLVVSELKRSGGRLSVNTNLIDKYGKLWIFGLISYYK